MLNTSFFEFFIFVSIAQDIILYYRHYIQQHHKNTAFMQKNCVLDYINVTKI